jgi:hypothetical protein
MNETIPNSGLICPDCECFIFRNGPRGGASQNLECVSCGTRLNVTWVSPLMMQHRPLPIVWAQRIPSEKDGGGVWREDMFPKVLQ